MKKIIFVLILLIPLVVKAEDKIEVKLSTCTDATSARVLLNNEEIKTKFIGIETGEYVIDNKNDEINGKTVDDYVCNLLTNAKKIEIEYEPNIDKQDKFGRDNVWIFIDDELLESHLVSIGYAKVAYLYDNYKYSEEILEKEKEAKENKRGLWHEDEIEEVVEEEPEQEEKKDDILSIIGDFFKNLFESIGNFFSGIVEEIINGKEN